MHNGSLALIRGIAAVLRRYIGLEYRPRRV